MVRRFIAHLRTPHGNETVIVEGPGSVEEAREALTSHLSADHHLLSIHELIWDHPHDHPTVVKVDLPLTMPVPYFQIIAGYMLVLFIVDFLRRLKNAAQ